MAALNASDFTLYDPATAASIVPGTTALFQVNVDSLVPTQLNAGLAEVYIKANGFDQQATAAALQTDLLSYVEPVVIGPGGVLYLTDGQHTFLALLDSSWGASNPLVYVNVIANHANDTTAQFQAYLQSQNLVYLANDGVVQPISTLATSLSGLTSDPYRGLEYSILKNKLSKLFTTTSDLTGAVGSAIPGVDKTAAFYSDFIWADAYRGANGGLGLSYLSPGDILLSTAWNLNPNSTTTLPGLGTVTAAQLPGFILGGNITITGTISNATLANGVLDASKTGTFDQATTFASFTGLRSLTVGQSVIGTNATGFVMQLGADNKYIVTLKGQNTYTGGTTIIAGTLNVNSDAALGAAATGGTIHAGTSTLVSDVEAANGIIFNSLTEGNGTLQLGASFALSRPIVLDGETASIDLNGYNLTLNSPLYSAGALGIGLSSAYTETPFQVEDTSKNGTGVLTLSASVNNANYYGNWVITSGTLNVSSDASLGYTGTNQVLQGQVELNGGTLQAGASFTSVRSLFLGGGSNYDTNGYNTVWQGNLQDVQRTLAVLNSSTTTAGSVTFGTFEAASTATLNVEAAAGKPANTVTVGGFIRDPQATLLLQDTTGGLGTNGFVMDTSTGNWTVPVNGIVSPWIAVQATTTTYGFATYGANGYVYTAGNSTNLATATATSVVNTTSTAVITNNTSAYALSVYNAQVDVNGVTLTLGTGQSGSVTGLILNGTGQIFSSVRTGGTLAVGAAELVTWLGGSAANTLSINITGTGGLTFAGAGSVNIGLAVADTGLVTVDSGVLNLQAANAFAASTQGVTLSNVKKSPSPATLNISTNQTFAALNASGSNSQVNLSAGAALTIGDSNNLSSAASSTITETGIAAAGALTKAGTGLFDLSGSSVTLVSGSTVLVNAGVLRVGNGVFGATASNTITIASMAELQYNGNGGSKLAMTLQGAGDFNLITGTVDLVGTNTYTGGTYVNLGTTLDGTTSSIKGNITDAGGTVVFDQTTAGTYAGVISDGKEEGGTYSSDPNETAASAAGPSEPGTLIKDDSTSDGAGNVTLSAAQTFTGATYIEAGTLTLGAVDTLKTSSGVTLGRVGGGATATLALGASNQIAGLSDTAGNTDNVSLGSYTLTIDVASGASDTFSGVIGGTGALVLAGSGTETLTGINTFTGGITVSSGTLALASAAAAGKGMITLGASGTLDVLDVAPQPAVAYSAGTLTLTGTSSSVHLKISLPSGDAFAVAADGTGGTLVTEETAAAISAVQGTPVNGGPIEVTGTGVAGQTVTLYADGGTTAVGTGTISNAGSFDVTTAAVFADGNHTLVAVETAANGAASSSAAVSIAVAPPAPSITAESAQTGTPITVTGTGEAGDAVTLYADGTVSGSGTVSSTGILTATTGSLAYGAHTITATETDTAGITSALGAGFSAVQGVISGPVTGGLTLGLASTSLGATAAVSNASGVGVYGPAGTAQSVTNAGSISGASYGVQLAGGGLVTNLGGGTVSGGTAGVALDTGVSLANAGTVSGGAYGILALGVPGSVMNTGAVTGGTVGVQLNAGGSVTNAAGGQITGSYGLYVNAPGTVVNAGTVTGTQGAGIYLLQGGTVTNQATGVIAGGTYGVFSNPAATVVNTGSISGVTGVWLGGGGTLVNAGTISGNSQAVHAEHNATLVIEPGAVFQGAVNGVGSGTRVVELASASSAGTVGSIGTASSGAAINGFSQVKLDAGATWTLAGNSPMVFLGGGGDTLTTGANAQPITINAALGNDTINLGSGLAVINEARTAAGGEVVNGFAANDVIHFTGFGAGSAITAMGNDVYTVSGASGTELLTVNGVALTSHNTTLA